MDLRTGPIAVRRLTGNNNWMTEMPKILALTALLVIALLALAQFGPSALFGG
jgi:hypothetical protein